MKSDVNGSLYVTSMPHEMMNNGDFFKNVALNESDFYIKNRNQIFSIVSYAISYESLLNLLIADKLLQMTSLTKEQKGILNYLKVDSNRNTPMKLRNIHKKIRFLEEIYKLKKKSLETKEFQEFYNNVIQLRNKIVHYTHSGHHLVYGQKCESICKTGDKLLIEACRSLCGKIGIEIPEYYKNMTSIIS